MRKALFIFFGIFICLIFFLVTDCFVNSTSRASRAATIASCWGDSITAGYAYQATGKNYPIRLQGMLNAAYGSGSYQVINRGLDGYRADQVRAKTSAWLAADSPDIVLLMIGTNDMTHGQTIESTRVEVQEIINLVTGHINPDGSRPRIIVSSVIPSLTYESWLLGLYNDDLASHLTGMASWFTSNWDDFYDGGTGLAKAWLMADDLHPNSGGYKVMAENWFEVITTIVLEVDPSSLDFGELGRRSSQAMTFRAYNAGGETLSGTISDNRDWISVSPTSFEGNDNTISVTVSTEGLVESFTPYTGTVTVTSNGGTKSVEVSVVVIPIGAVPYPNPFSLSRHTKLTLWGTSVAHAKTQIFTLTGELVKTLEETYGVGKVLWDGRNEKGVKVARGVYIFVVGSYSGKIAIVE